MTAAALREKLEGATPPPSNQEFDLLGSPEFDALAAEAQRIQEMSRTVEAFKGKGSVPGYEFNGGQKDIEAMLTASDVEAVLWRDGYVVKIGKGRSADTISATKLVEQGVSLDIIAAATVEGKPYTYAQIVAPKAPKVGK